MVSAALVAEREIDEAATTTAIPCGEESEPVLVRPNPYKEAQGREDSSKVTARKKVVQRPVYFVSSLL